MKNGPPSWYFSHDELAGSTIIWPERGAAVPAIGKIMVTNMRRQRAIGIEYDAVFGLFILKVPLQIVETMCKFQRS
jgi:hypothetical protein